MQKKLLIITFQKDFLVLLSFSSSSFLQHFSRNDPTNCIWTVTKVHNSSDTIGRHQGEEHAHPAGEMQPSSWCPALVSREKRGETSSPPGTFVIWRNRCIYWIRNTSTESVGATIDFRYRILPLNLTTTYIQLHLALDCSKQFNLLFVYNLKKSCLSISFFFHICFSCLIPRNFILSSFQDLYIFHHSISWIKI